MFQRRGGRELCFAKASGIFPNEFRGFALLLPANHDGLAILLLPIASHFPDAHRSSSPGGRLHLCAPPRRQTFPSSNPARFSLICGHHP